MLETPTVLLRMPRKSKKSAEVKDDGDPEPSSAKGQKKISKKMAKLALDLSDEEEVAIDSSKTGKRKTMSIIFKFCHTVFRMGYGRVKFS